MKIALLGDIALHGAFGVSNETKAPPEALFAIGERLQAYDWVVGNLETPLTHATRPFGPKSAHIRARPVDEASLKALGVHAVSLANNHSFDFGEVGFSETLEVLESAGIRAYGYDGVSVVLGEGPDTAELHGFCCYSTNPVGVDPSQGPARLNVLSVEGLTAAVKGSREAGHMPIASIHWGDEYVHLPRWDHVVLARNAAAAGVYVLHGHHPHVLQGIEEKDGALLAYSLGNFCFDAIRVPGMRKPLVTPTQASRETGFLEVEMRGGDVLNWRFHALRFDGASYRDAPEVAGKVDAYTSRLPNANQGSGPYMAERKTVLEAQAERRKKDRSLEWLVYRLRLRTLLNRIASRRNRSRYDAHIRRPIGEIQRRSP